MDQKAAIELTVDYVRQALAGDSSGHDWWHVARVWQTARNIAASEHADPFIVELAALLHDIADWKFSGGDESAGPRAARQWLERLHIAPDQIDHVCEIVAHLSFKGAGVPTPMATVEGAIVQDADRLDAIGAIGIARAFAYGGYKGRALYDPACPPERHESFAAYKQSTAPTLNHFYEKLLLLRDRMNTATAKRIASERHQFMESFLERFLAEWNAADVR